MPDIHKSLEKQKLNNTILLSQQFRMALSKNYNVLKVWRNLSHDLMVGQTILQLLLNTVQQLLKNKQKTKIKEQTYQRSQ